MKNNIIAGLVLAVVFTSGGWAMFHDYSQKLTEIIIDKNIKIEQKSTEIANLEIVIVKKDDDLNAKEMVIQEQTLQVNKLNEEIKAKNTEVEAKNAEIASLKKKLTEGSDVGGQTLMMEASGYIALCSEGCSGKTRSGYDVRNTIYYQGMRIIASDLSVLPMYSIVKIEGFSEKFIVLDSGGAINGNKIDVLFSSTNEAIKFGRKDLKVKVIRNGA